MSWEADLESFLWPASECQIYISCTRSWAKAIRGKWEELEWRREVSQVGNEATPNTAEGPLRSTAFAVTVFPKVL